MKSSIQLRYGEKCKPDFSLSKSSGAGRFYCSEHWHDSFEIIFVATGKLVITIAGKRTVMEAGDVSIIPPCVIHGTDSDNGYTEFYCLGYSKSLIYSTDISFENMKYLLPFYRITGTESYVLTSANPSVNELCRLLLEAMDIYSENNAAKNLFIRAKILEIHATIVSLLLENTDFAGYKNEYLQKAELYIEEHITEDISPYEIANALHVSYSHLAKEIRNSIGYTLGELIVRRKINYAEALLNDSSGAGVTDIAIKAGFASASYFTKCFKRIKGVTPRKFKEMLSH